MNSLRPSIPPEKYGVLEIKENKVIIFKEKEPMEGLVKNNQLNAYKHHGFYQHVDTVKGKNG